MIVISDSTFIISLRTAYQRMASGNFENMEISYENILQFFTKKA